MRDRVYIATAYRYGWTNNGHYIVCVNPNRCSVLDAAEVEHEASGGKYGVEVVEHTFDLDGPETTTISYFPSSYGEQAPHMNHRIQVARSVGLMVLDAIDRKDQKRSVPAWLQVFVLLEIKCMQAMNPGTEFFREFEVSPSTAGE